MAKHKLKSTFLKDPIDSIMAHIGKILDRSSVKDFAEVGIMGGLALACYNIAKKNGWDPLSTILVGEVGYKLALAPNVVSAGSGIGTLAVLGLTGILDTKVLEWFSQPPSEEYPLGTVPPGRT